MIVFEKPPGVIHSDSFESGGNNVLGEKSVQVSFFKSLLEFIEGMGDHLKKKDLVNRRVPGFPTSCQQSYQILFKNTGGGNPLVN